MRYFIPATSINDIIYINAVGNTSQTVEKASNIRNSNHECISFYRGDSLEVVENIKSGILLVENSLFKRMRSFKSLCVLACDNPKFRFAEVINNKNKVNRIHNTNKTSTYISDTFEIDDSSLIGTNVSILGSVKIDKNCKIQSGSIIGGDGLGDVYFNGKYHPFPHLGRVVVEEDVHIGCNVTILRGMLEDTIIKKGTRIANNVCIGHSTSIGENCYISSGVSIGGACKIKANSWIGIGSTLTDNIIVEENTMIGTGSVLIKNALPNSLYLGNPARKISERK